MTTLSSTAPGFQSQFNYSNIPEPLQTEAESLVSRVRVCLRKTNTEALELARQINHLREQMSAKQFKAWLSHYFPDAESQIRTWLKVVELAERLPEYVEQMMGWATGALAALSRGSDELVKNVLCRSEKLTIKAIEILVRQERGEPDPSPPTPPPTQTTIRLAKLTTHKVNLETELSQAVTPEAQERLIYDIKQTEDEIKQLCCHLDPHQIETITVNPQQRTLDLNSASTQQSSNSTQTSSYSQQLQKLQEQLHAEQQKNSQLLAHIEQLSHQFLQQYQQQIEQLQQQLQQKEELITQLQNHPSESENPIFQPKFAPAQLEELKLNDRIRVHSPGNQNVVDDLIIAVDQYNRPQTKWFGVLMAKDVEAGWTFERMIGVEKAQSQLSQLQQENRQLKQQLAEFEQLNHHIEADRETPQLEKQLESTQSQLKQQQQQLDILLQWQERLQQKVHNQLESGVVVEILFDSKGIWTGCLGTVVQEFKRHPGHWWVSLVHPQTQKNYRELFPAYQLYLPAF
jgi:flagellar biosynthesis chaperone FliJ